MIKKRVLYCLVCLLILAGVYEGAQADPLLSQGRMIGERIMLFPDHATPNVFYYVPTKLDLTRAYGKPQFFFYKYVYIKSDSSGETERMAGGVLTLSVEFSDESAESLKERRKKRKSFPRGRLPGRKRISPSPSAVKQPRISGRFLRARSPSG